MTEPSPTLIIDHPSHPFFVPRQFSSMLLAVLASDCKTLTISLDHFRYRHKKNAFFIPCKRKFSTWHIGRWAIPGSIHPAGTEVSTPDKKLSITFVDGTVISGTTAIITIQFRWSSPKEKASELTFLIRYENIMEMLIRRIFVGHRWESVLWFSQRL